MFLQRLLAGSSHCAPSKLLSKRHRQSKDVGWREMGAQGKREEAEQRSNVAAPGLAGLRRGPAWPEGTESAGGMRRMAGKSNRGTLSSGGEAPLWMAEATCRALRAPPPFTRQHWEPQLTLTVPQASPCTPHPRCTAPQAHAAPHTCTH